MCLLCPFFPFLFGTSLRLDALVGDVVELDAEVLKVWLFLDALGNGLMSVWHLPEQDAAYCCFIRL